MVLENEASIVKVGLILPRDRMDSVLSPAPANDNTGIYSGISETLPPSFVSKSFAMLHLVGLGLADETDVTVKGLDLIKKAERVYLEAYTSILLVDSAKLVSLLCELFISLETDCGAHSRKPIMAAQSSSQTGRWSSLPAMIF